MSVPATADTPLPRYVRQPEARRMLGITARGLKKLIDRGVLPEPFEVTSRLKVFRLDDVIAAIERPRRPTA
jgi:hypothetical protein